MVLKVAVFEFATIGSVLSTKLAQGGHRVVVITGGLQLQANKQHGLLYMALNECLYVMVASAIGR